MKKIGIVTSSKELNYGAILQACALQNFIGGLGYKGELLWWDNQTKSHHDFRIRKVLSMAKTGILHPSLIYKTLNIYGHAMNKEFSQNSKNMFEEFEIKNLCIRYCSYAGMKEYATSEEVLALVCGSDQIWNSHALYIDPFYYLRFAPKSKRIAYAPSLGKSTIPDYNRRKMNRYISEIPYLSVREHSGQVLLEELTGRKVKNVCDPSFLLNRSEWQKFENSLNLDEEYLLLYFLDETAEPTKRQIRQIAKELGIRVYCLPYMFDFGIDTKLIHAGPAEFLYLIANAKMILTDSFHGTAFSVNFQKPFLTFARQYGSNEKQESRLLDLLRLVGLENRYVADAARFSTDEIMKPYDTTKLRKHVEESKAFLVDSINGVKKG